MYSQLTVDSDECAVFFKDGRAIGVLPPGRHTMHTSNIPFLGMLVNSFTGGNMWISEIFFVKTTPVREVKFGGSIPMMRDPQLKCLVTPRINGEMSLVVTDPQAFIVGYAGQAAAAQDNETILSWIRTSFMNGVKQTIGEFCIRQKITFLELAAYQQELCTQFIAHAPETDRIGIRILQLATFNTNFNDEDNRKLNDANERFVMAVGDAEVEVQRAPRTNKRPGPSGRS
jgi:membrane protease subunit (stomatin/prohibitin family)